MMYSIRSKGIACMKYIKASRRLVSNQIKEVLDTRLEPPSGYNVSQLQLAFVSKNLNALNLDVFVNNLTHHEDRTSTILDLLANLRATKSANNCLESTHFAVVRHLLENLTLQELVPVLLNRPKYGIFLNNFTAFAVTQTLNEQKEYNLGLSLALKLVLSEEVDSLFVLGFCLKASLVALKTDILKQQSPDNITDSIPKGKVQEIKVRVKYLRNVNNPDVYNEMGRAILKIKSKILEGNTKTNAEILGLILTKNYIELDKALNTQSIKIYEDVQDICKKLISPESQLNFINKIDKMQEKMSLENLIDKFLEEVAVKEAASLAETQKILLPVWQEARTQLQSKVEREAVKKERKENINVIKNEIAAKKELLWFFDDEDKLDLEIHKKKVYYPKKWFGKKKKPRVVDEHYVPPQIRKIK